MAKKTDQVVNREAGIEEVPAPETAVAEIAKGGELAEVSQMDSLFMEDAGGGFGNMSGGDFSLPFMTILQKGSPQVSRANAKYIKGAEVGQIMNTVTSDTYSGELGIPYIPCGYAKQLVRWRPRDSGGGLVCHYSESDPALAKFVRNERGQLSDPDTKDIIIDTAYHFGLYIPETGFPEMAVISMASTQLKASRNWNTIMRRVMKKDPRSGRIFNPPSYSHIYRLTTVGQTKDTYDWFGWKILTEAEVTDPQIYLVAREFAQQVAAGKVKVSAPPQEFVEPEVEDGEKVPF